jgi:hypothetical protein
MFGRGMRGTKQRPKTSGRVVGRAIKRKVPGFNVIADTARPNLIAIMQGGESDSGTNDGTKNEIVL